MKVFIAIFAYLAVAQASGILSAPSYVTSYNEPAKLVVPVQQQTTIQTVPLRQQTIQTVHAVPVKQTIQTVQTVPVRQTIQTIRVAPIRAVPIQQVQTVQTVRKIQTVPVRTVQTIRTIPAAIQRVQTLRSVPLQTIPVQTYKAYRNVPLQQNYVVSSNGIIKK